MNLRRLISSLFLTASVVVSSFAIPAAQPTFKGEVLAPTIVVRVKQRPAVDRDPDRQGARLKRASGAFTYAADRYLELFEDTLAEGNSALAGKDFPTAVLEFDRAGASTADDPRPSIGAGYALAMKGDLTRALLRLQDAQKLLEAPDLPLPPGTDRTNDSDQLYSILGFVNLKLGNLNEAATALSAVSNLSGSAGAVVLNNLGIADAQAANYSAAEEHFQRAQALDQKNQSVRMNRGLLYVLLRNPEKAIAVQREFASSDPYRAGVLQREIENMRPPTEP